MESGHNFVFVTFFLGNFLKFLYFEVTNVPLLLFFP